MEITHYWLLMSVVPRRFSHHGLVHETAKMYHVGNLGKLQNGHIWMLEIKRPN